MKVLVGLGNPGKAYDGTPHNIGFEVMDRMAAAERVTFRSSWRFPLVSAEIEVAGQAVLLVKPQTFMNRSGDAVAPLLRKKGVAPADLLVLVDDVELPTGTLRMRGSGSAGNHNGLKSLIERIGTADFPRLRMGLGPVPAGRNRVDYVLGKYPPETRTAVADLMDRAAGAARTWVDEGLERAMNQFNG
jgi:PTH1 family peptidyl-tRNA hydrolase